MPLAKDSRGVDARDLTELHRTEGPEENACHSSTNIRHSSASQTDVGNINYCHCQTIRQSAISNASKSILGPKSGGEAVCRDSRSEPGSITGDAQRSFAGEHSVCPFPRTAICKLPKNSMSCGSGASIAVVSLNVFEASIVPQLSTTPSECDMAKSTLPAKSRKGTLDKRALVAIRTSSPIPCVSLTIVICFFPRYALARNITQIEQCASISFRQTGKMSIRIRELPRNPQAATCRCNVHARRSAV